MVRPAFAVFVVVLVGVGAILRPLRKILVGVPCRLLVLCGLDAGLPSSSTWCVLSYQ